MRASSSTPLHETPVQHIKGIGESVALKLAALGITSVADLLFHMPRGYEDRSRVRAIESLQDGMSVMVEGMVTHVEQNRFKHSLTAELNDGTGKITLRYFHVYKGLVDRLSQAGRLRLFGEVRYGYKGFEMVHPEFVKNAPNTTNTPALTPIYPLTDGITQLKLRQHIHAALAFMQHNITDLMRLLPDQPHFQFSITDAIRFIHNPPLDAHIDQLLAGTHPAQQRLAYEELLAHQLGLLKRRDLEQALPAFAFEDKGQLKTQLLQQLPFKPTQAQQRVSQEISLNLSQQRPMLRLVQGDVGSGKTLVAAMSTAQVLDHGWQVAIMAPTEILAEQHFLQFSRWFTHLNVHVAWLSGKQKAKEKQLALQHIASGDAHIVVGTHALFQQDVAFKQLGLVIVDEQHRFGVNQRLALKNKGTDTLMPHQLAMTATPIPRTLAMSVYGDMDTSIIDELPPGRTPIQTVTIPRERKTEVLARIAHSCMQGKQAYWVCTLVEESEVIDAQAAEATYAEICQALPELRIALVHGRLKAEEKQQIMESFKSGHVQLLVATTVIEVGVDVPNASLMVIENAERLGLSQLHQLRGRVGRGSTQSFCVLLYKTPLSAMATARLGIMRESTDGFFIAEKDLELRGPGEVFGTRQTGVVGFKVADLSRDASLLAHARRSALALYQQEQEQQHKAHAGHTPLLSDLFIRRWLVSSSHFASV